MRVLGVALILAAATLTTSSQAEPAPAPNCARVCEPTVKPFLLPLPIGAVQPQGWLRDWAESARDGITGHLDERHPTFADGWKGLPIHALGLAADCASRLELACPPL